MSRTLQFRRLGTATLANTIGANGELIINSTNKALTVHDGTTPGGFALLNQTTDNNIDQYARNTANTAINSISVLQSVNNEQNNNITLISNELDTKFSIFGGQISGDINVIGDLDVSNNIAVTNLTVTETINVNNVLTVTTSSPSASPSISSISTANYTLTLGANNNTYWSFNGNGTLRFPNSSVQTGGSISIIELKALVANSATYAAFQSAIAAL
jgi:hypothetical protein